MASITTSVSDDKTLNTAVQVSSTVPTRGKGATFFSSHWLLLLCGALVFVSLRLALKTSWPGAGLAIDPQTALKLLSPLLLAAGFIERAVEIIVSPWRDAEAAVLQDCVDMLKAKAMPTEPIAARGLQDQLAAAQRELQVYRGKTQQYAFCASIVMSLGAAVVGVRALGPFSPSSLAIGGAQLAWFKAYDVVLSACLLAGGADGLHSVITLFTTFFDATTEKMQNSAKAVG